MISKPNPNIPKLIRNYIHESYNETVMIVDFVLQWEVNVKQTINFIHGENDNLVAVGHLQIIVKLAQFCNMND